VPLEKLTSLQYGGIDPRRLLHYLALKADFFEAVLTDEPVHVIEIEGIYYMIGGNHKATAAFMRGKENLRCQVISLSSFSQGEQNRITESVLRQSTQFEEWARTNNYAGRRVYAWEVLKQQFIRLIEQYL
jgi:hypothetical protein